MELFSDKPGDEGLPGPARRLAMIAVMTATAMAVFDGTIVNVALPQIGRALDVPAGEAVWVANGYLLAAAMALATFASLATRVGFRVLFAGGLAAFTLASLGCALSSSLGMLTVMRVLQGVGGAATLSIAPAIHRTVFPNRLLGRIMGLHALLIATCTAIGPSLGGAMLSFLSWPWLFAINVPLGVIGMALALRAIPETRTEADGRFDVAGAVLSAVAMGTLILAADACSQLGVRGKGWQAALTAGAYGLTAVAAGMAFVWRQRRAAQPLLPLAMFSSSRFSMAALTSLASFVGQGITFVALPFLFQNALGFSAFQSALLFTPWPVGIMLVAPRAGRLADRHPPAVLSTAGLVLFTIGLALLALLPEHAQTWDIGWRSLVCGIGFGFFQSPNNREMLANVSRELSSHASGVLAIVRTFGQSLGAAVVGIVLSAYAVPGVQPVRLCLGIAVVATVLAAAISFGRISRST